MSNSDPINRATKFLKDNSFKESSIARKLCILTLDLLLLVGFIFLSLSVKRDWDYWQAAPYPLYIFILL